MTEHDFEHPLANIHYYKFGTGSQYIFCFHGYGMHGKQFKFLEQPLGDKYTFIGFDLFFHKETKLRDTSLPAVKKGIKKSEWAGVIEDFCKSQHIERFSLLGYSMGTVYATALVEEMGDRINAYIMAAPTALAPGLPLLFFSENRLGNKLLEKLMISEKAMMRLIGLFRAIRVIDHKSREILIKEVGTRDLRYAMYASFTYMRTLRTDEEKLIRSLKVNNIRSIFIFGERDNRFGPAKAKYFTDKCDHAEVVILNEDHDMINSRFADTLVNLAI